jgi:hypothetical protein
VRRRRRRRSSPQAASPAVRWQQQIDVVGDEGGHDQIEHDLVDLVDGWPGTL